MKKTKFLIFFLIFLSSFFLIKDRNRRFKKNTYLKVFSKNKFFKKLKKAPFWMDRQIALDFDSTHKISERRLNRTFERISQNPNPLKNQFIRYRIFQNKLYRFYEKKQPLTNVRLDFEKAINTLSKIIKLPSIDFIYCNLDGLPLIEGNKEIDVKEEFYLTLDKQNQAPIFCSAKIKNAKNLILIPDHNSFSDSWFRLSQKVLKKSRQTLWKQKFNKAFWRGGSNDKKYFFNNYKNRPRFKISKLSLDNLDLLDAGITKSWFFQQQKILEKENVIKNYQSEIDQIKFKYLLAIDGHMCTYPGYQWRLLSSSATFKQESNEVQWFYSALKPYEHFVPIKNDMSDVLEKINWAIKNDDKLREIALNSKSFAENNLMTEDVYVYLFKVLKTYVKHQNFDDKVLKENVSKDKRWVCLSNRRKANYKLKKLGYEFH